MINYRVSQQFSKTPGGLYKSDGNGSAESFRDDVLYPLYMKLSKTNDFGIVNFDINITEYDKLRRPFLPDGCTRPSQKISKELIYTDEWLKEAFGGFVKKYGRLPLLRRITFFCSEDETLVPRIKRILSTTRTN